MDKIKDMLRGVQIGDSFSTNVFKWNNVIEHIGSHEDTSGELYRMRLAIVPYNDLGFRIKLNEQV